MNGELTVLPPEPPISGVVYAHNQPPCRRGISETIVYLGTIGPKLNSEEAAEMFDKSEPILLRTIEGAQQATPEDCASCLEGLGIKCPARAVSAEEARYLTRLNGLPQIAAGRMIEIVEHGASPDSSKKELIKNELLVEELDFLGFRQKRIVNAEPTHRLVVKDLRDPKSIEKDILQSNKREDRPPCAGTLASYLKACRKTFGQWVKVGQQRNVQNWSKRRPPDLEVHSALYDLGVEQAKDATPEQCAACMEDSCPLKQGVPGEEAFNALKDEISIEGKRTKPLDKVDSVLRGVPKKLLAGPPNPKAVWSKVQDILRDLAEKVNPEELEEF